MQKVYYRESGNERKREETGLDRAVVSDYDAALTKSLKM